MPKIIENVREKIIAEAKRQIEESGYESVTIRNIARGCSLGLGTFYNYFKSKDVLIATFLLEDWQERISRVIAESEGENDPLAVTQMLCDEISQFIESNKRIFTANEAIKSFNATVGSYHKVLRAQIAEPIKSACIAGGYEDAEFLSLFVAESTLTWVTAGKTYGELASVFTKLFVK